MQQGDRAHAVCVKMENVWLEEAWSSVKTAFMGHGEICQATHCTGYMHEASEGWQLPGEGLDRKAKLIPVTLSPE